MKTIIHKGSSPDKWFFIGLLFLFGFTPKENIENNANSVHPFHVSVFEINHNAGTKSVEVTCKLISEDLESILRTKNGVAVDLAAEKDQEKNEKMIDAYIRQNFSLNLDGKAAVLKMVGFEKEKESVYAYFEVTDIASVSKIELKNSVLYDLTKDQGHIVHAIVGGKRQSKKLNYPDQLLEFIF